MNDIFKIDLTSQQFYSQFRFLIQDKKPHNDWMLSLEL